MTEVNSRVSENASVRCLSPKKTRRKKKSITYYSKLREAIFHLHVSNILPPVVGGTIQHYLSQGKKEIRTSYLFFL